MQHHAHTPNAVAVTITPGIKELSIFNDAWNWRIPKPYTPVLFSMLGDAFIELEDGSITWLNCGTGELLTIANNKDHFRNQLLDGTANQWLRPHEVESLSTQLGRPGPHQCYTYESTRACRILAYAMDHYAQTGKAHRDYYESVYGEKDIMGPSV